MPPPNPTIAPREADMSATTVLCLVLGANAFAVIMTALAVYILANDVGRAQG